VSKLGCSRRRTRPSATYQQPGIIGPIVVPCCPPIQALSRRLPIRLDRLTLLVQLVALHRLPEESWHVTRNKCFTFHPLSIKDYPRSRLARGSRDTKGHSTDYRRFSLLPRVMWVQSDEVIRPDAFAPLACTRGSVADCIPLDSTGSEASC
jgi:hypothetical protein